MGFLAPYMLWGAAAAGIPIALHFFFRSRYRTVPWAAMKFLLTSIEQTSRRLKFQELLLLVARVALLLLLAFALARPLSHTVAGGKGEAVDAVFLFDTSYSMGARDADVTRLDRAKSAALGIIDQLPAHSTVQVVACADRSALLGPRSASNLDQARDLINKLELTQLATDFRPGIDEAASVLQRGQSPNKELYLFSDMQTLGFEQQAAPLAAGLKDLSSKATIYFVRCGSQQPKNVAIVGIVPQTELPRPGQRLNFSVMVRNTGTEPITEREVTLELDRKKVEKEAQSLPSLAPGQTRAVTLSGVVEGAGQHVVTAHINHDDLKADNRFDQVFLVRDQIRILVVDGSPNERDPRRAGSFDLNHILLPIDQESARQTWHLKPMAATAGTANPGMLANQDVCILVNVGLDDGSGLANRLSPEFLDQLNSFVRQGHGLIIFGGDNVTADSYNRILGEQFKLLPAKLAGLQQRPADNPLHFNRDSITLPSFARLRDDEYFKGLNAVKVWRSLIVQEGEAARGKEDPAAALAAKESSGVILRYDDGKPAIVRRRAGAGEVIFVATSASPGWKQDSIEPTWNEWSFDAFRYMSVVHTAIAHLLQGQTQSHNAVAGQSLVYYPPDRDASRSFALVTPGGKSIKLGTPTNVEGRPLITLENLQTAGIYRLLTAAAPGMEIDTEKEGASDQGLPFAVVPDLRESANLSTLTDAQVDERLGFKPIHVIAGADASSFGVERSNREWTWWALLAVLLVTLGEGVLAWICGRAW